MNSTHFLSDEIFDLMDRLRDLDVKLFLEGDQLRYSAPKGVLDSSLLNRLKAGKQDLISFLKLQNRATDQLEEAIPANTDSADFPLSFAQQRFWFLDQLAGGNSPIYNMLPIVLQVDGPLQIKSLESALATLLERHKVLSNRFSIEGDEPRQWPGQDGKVPVTHYDLSDTDSTDIESNQPVSRENQIARIILEEGERPFDLAKGGPLLRLGLIKLAPQRHIFILTLHHIVADGWSLGNLVSEFTQLYQAAETGTSLTLPPLSIQYGDFARWERQRLDDLLLRRYLHFWKRELRGAPHLLELPTDRSRPHLQTYNGRTHAFMLEKTVAKQVQACANRYGVTPFMVLLTLFGILLGRYSRQDDLVIGSPLSVRKHPQCEPLVGLFLNTIPLRIDLSGNPGFADLLLRVRKTALAAYEHGEVPFEDLLQALDIGRALNHTPLFQVLFALQNAPVGKLDTGDLTITPLEPENSKAPFDLVLSMEEVPEGIRGRFRFNTDLFDLATVTRMAGHFKELLVSALKESDRPVKQLAMIPEPELKETVQMRGGEQHFPVTESLSEIIESVVQAQPEAEAVAFGESVWTYKQLGTRADSLAGYLLESGVKPGDRVGVCMNRSADLIAVLIAILKTGAAYVPLDVTSPRERLEYMVNDAGIDVVVTDTEAAGSVPSTVRDLVDISSLDHTRPAEKLKILDSPSDVAYVIYTSGSTGRPKGVEVTHSNVIRLFRSTESLFGFTGEDVWTLFHSYAFDFSVWEIFGALLYGGKLVVVPYWVSRSPDEFFDLLQAEKVTVLNQTPSAFRQLVEIDRRDGGRETSLKWVIFGGEALEMKSLEGWCTRHGFDQPQLINMYGITETTVHVTFHRVTEADLTRGISVIGSPLPDLTVDLLDEFGSPVPVGVPGEIVVGGGGVARGYLNRPELTAERFVDASKFGNHHVRTQNDSDKLYRSGDLARRLPDGRLEYLGRIDQQVKIRGFRIELGEIEACLMSYPEVASAVVIVRTVEGSNELTGYVVLQAGTDSSGHIPAIREKLGKMLPDYMIPAALVLLDEIPLTINGKVDRKALPDPDREERVDETAYIAPSTELEQLLARLWKDVLHIEKIGIRDNFFEMGGDSIKGAIFANRMQQETGAVFYVVALFEAPTITEMIEYMRIHYPDTVLKYEGEDSPGAENKAYTKNGLSHVDSPASSGNPDTQSDPAETTYKTNGSVGVRSESRLERTDLQTLREAIEPLATHPGILDSPKNSRAIFVLAPPRSGTTLLRVLLGGHSSLFAPPELELMPFNTLNERKETYTGGDSFWLEGTIRAVMELKNCDVDTAKEILAEREEAGMSVKNFYGEIQEWLGERILVDKSPSYVLDSLILERIEATFEDPLYIHLHRHPCGMIHSFEEARLQQIFFRYPHSFSPKQLAELIWVHSHQTITRFLHSIPENRQLQISFEELTRTASTEVERMCNFIGLDFESDMLAIYEEQEKKKRMTDGLYKESTMLGDVKFHTHKRIDASASDRWRDSFGVDFLSDMSRETAREMGYQDIPAPSSKNNSNDTKNGEGKRTLSYSQKRLWFLDQLEGSGNTYNMPIALWLSGPLDTEAMLKSVKAIPARHEVLRSTFTTEDGEPVCRLTEELLPSIVDLSMLDPKEREQEALQWLEKESNRPFDLTTGPLFRATLVKLNPDRHLLIINMHHIVSDGWSLGIVSKELEQNYNFFSGSGESASEPLALQYNDYALWQKELFNSGELNRQMGYWKSQLGDIPALLELPADRPRPARKSYKGKTGTFHINAGLVRKAKKLAEASGSTLYMALLAVFGLLMNRYSGQTVIPVGSPVANRRDTNFEPLIGFFVNTLVMKVTVHPDETFSELLKRVRQVALEAYSNQDVSFEQIVDELQPERNLGYSPLFQVMMTMQTTGVSLPELQDIHAEVADYTNTISKYDLTLLFADEKGGLNGFIEYSTDIFDEWRIRQLAENFTELLQAITEGSDVPVKQLPLLSPATQGKLTSEWNRTETEWSGPETLHEVISKQAAESPDRIAMVCGREQMNYGDLERKANRLAHLLLDLGLKKRSRVAVALERSNDMVVTLLAILKTGCCYVPLDPGYPVNRIEMIFEDADIDWLLTHSALKELIPECKHVVLIDELTRDDSIKASEKGKANKSIAQYPDTPPDSDVTGDDLAYVIFTSGSTGRPKGVMIPHRAVRNFLFTMASKPGIAKDDTVLAVTTIAFDIAVLELWAPLVKGAQIVLATETEARDGEALLRLIERGKITLMQATPATWNLLIESGWTGSPGLRCLCGGEAMQRQLADEILKRCSELWNMYGPTETTVWSTIQQIDKNRSHNEVVEPIGRPIANTDIFILDDELNPVPPGIPGELYIGGHGVAAGYLNQPDMTTERFLKNPFKNSGRIYRTGDLARYRQDGVVEYLGRADQQVKLRGFRIELGEIEYQLQQYPGILQCAVAIQGDGVEARLAAFYVMENKGEPIHNQELRVFLSASLPDYMVPSVFYVLEAMPLTPNGKLDRKVLNVPDGQPGAFVEVSKTVVRDLTELRLLHIWQNLLDDPSIGTDDNFFDVGGHSLIAVRLMAGIGVEFGRQLPLATLFQNPTVSQLARLLRKEGSTDVWNTLVEIRPGKPGRPPLFCAPGAGGNVLYLQPLSQVLDNEVPFYGLQPDGLDGLSPVAESVEGLASRYIEAIKTVDSEGPWQISGHSFGGTVAFEMARQLKQSGQDIRRLILLDSPAPQWVRPTGLDWTQAEWLSQVAQIASHQYGVDLKLSANSFDENESGESQLLILQQRLIEAGIFPADADINHLRGFMNVYRTNLQMVYQPEKNRLDVDMLLVRSADLQPDEISDEQAKLIRSHHDLGWGQWISGSIDIIEVPGDHLTMLNPPHVRKLAEGLNSLLAGSHHTMNSHH